MKFKVTIALFSIALLAGNSSPSLALANDSIIEDFESSCGGWSSGVISDTSTWACGTPNKTIINGASSGSNAWVNGGLTDYYAKSENSYVESPCYDLSCMEAPYLSLDIWWEVENEYDGAAVQYSTDCGSSWNDLGAKGDSNCFTKNWYNNDDVNYLTTGNQEGWSGHNGTLINDGGNSCASSGEGSGDWVTASHCLNGLGGESNVKFRVVFGGGTVCEGEGFAFDDFEVREAEHTADFTITSCNTVNFKQTEVFFEDQSTPCAEEDWEWHYGDGDSDCCSDDAPSHKYNYNDSCIYEATLISTNVCGGTDTITKTVDVCDCGVLPLEMNYFNATPLSQQSIGLQWQTLTEQNHAAFVVQRSQSGEHFENLANIQGAGTTQQPNSYEYIDNNPHQGVNYYRLKNISINGHTSYSRTITGKVAQEKFEIIKIHKQPGSNKLNLQVYASSPQKGQVQLYNTAGQQLLSTTTHLKKGYQTIQLPYSSTSSEGLLFFKLITSQQHITRKVVAH
jgi:hypothetical protein